MDQLGVVLYTISYKVLDEACKYPSMKLTDSEVRIMAREKN